MDCGPTCLRMIARHYGKVYDAEFLRDRCSITREGVSPPASRRPESIGMSSLAVQVSFESLRRNPASLRAHWRQRHFVVVYAVVGDTVHLADPGRPHKYSKKEFLKLAERPPTASSRQGLLLLLEPTPNFTPAPIRAPSSAGPRLLLPISGLSSPVAADCAGAACRSARSSPHHSDPGDG
jgi:ATP-binding cassette subfamily B protein